MITFLTSKISDLRDANFITRCTFGISLVAFLIMLPFGINNFFQGRFVGGFTALLVAFLFLANVALAFRGKYNLYVNLLSIVPALGLASITALITLQVMGAFWSFLCVFAIYFVLPFRFAKHASWVYVIVVLSVAWFSLEQAIAIRFCVVLIGITIFIFIFSREMDKAKRKLIHQAETDPLTGIYNRTKLDFFIQKAISEYEAASTSCTLCIIDVDHFKSINDNMGHEAGDRVLIELASQLKTIISHKDVVFRIGGEEFLLLMNGTGSCESNLIAEAIREVIASTPFLVSLAHEQQSTKTFKVTVSIGLAEISDNQTAQQWMNNADQNLYIAKQQGRNRVVS